MLTVEQKEKLLSIVWKRVIELEKEIQQYIQEEIDLTCTGKAILDDTIKDLKETRRLYSKVCEIKAKIE